MGGNRRVLIIGGGFSGMLAAKDLKWAFDVTIVDAKEFFEYTPGILRAFVKPSHFEALSFSLAPAIEKKIGVKFIWGEVKNLDGVNNVATIKPRWKEDTEDLAFDYCIICSGCNFNFLHKYGESLWFPTIYEEARPHSSWSHIDERTIEGRRRHIYEEYEKIKKLAEKKAKILVCGAGFIGVEWVTELQYFFPSLDLTVIDFLPNCLGPLPQDAQKYCDNYMRGKGIKTVYGVKYEPQSKAFWEKIGLPNGADETYICMGVKASNYFMPRETLSDKGPGGGGWIHINKKLQVCTKDNKVWGSGKVFAVGDCNFGCVGGPADWAPGGKGIPPIPKISYPGEEQAHHAAVNVKSLDYMEHGDPGGVFSLCIPSKPMDTWWPWGAGMFATSLGPHDACFVLGANSTPGSGFMLLKGWMSVILKEFLEASIVDAKKGGMVCQLVWYFVHHTPIHLWGEGACWK
jgi:NADH dehydrogenase FAD-containing subunit